MFNFWNSLQKMLYDYYKILLNAKKYFNLYEHKSIFYRINKQNLSMCSSIRYIPLMHSVHKKIYKHSISPGNICKTNLYSSIRTTLTFCINFYHPSPILYDAIENTLIRFWTCIWWIWYDTILYLKQYIVS